MPIARKKPHHTEPFESSVTLATLPPADTERWVARRKAQVVGAVQAGLLTIDEALARYKLTLEEFSGWQSGLYRHGLRGLQITHLQICKLTDRGKAGRRTRKSPRWRRRHA